MKWLGWTMLCVLSIILLGAWLGLSAQSGPSAAHALAYARIGSGWLSTFIGCLCVAQARCILRESAVHPVAVS
ncbi:MAG: hypothetical protein QM758_08065 [Armatimonas sp.]